MGKSITEIRNAKIVGNNCASYNDKHPENPVSLRPIHDAIENTLKILDSKHRIVPDTEHIAYIRSLGNLPRMDIARMAKLR